MADLVEIIQAALHADVHQRNGYECSDPSDCPWLEWDEARIAVKAILSNPPVVLRALGGEDDGFVPVLKRGGGRKTYAQWRFLVSED